MCKLKQRSIEAANWGLSCGKNACNNKVVDVYVNGVITKRVTFSSVPKQNFGDVHVNSSGYDGQLSDLRYFDMGLDVFQIKNS